MANIRYYLTTEQGTKLDYDALNELKAKCPNFLKNLGITDNVQDIQVLVGNGNKHGSYPEYAQYHSYTQDTYGGFEKIDSSKPFAFYVTDMSRNTDSSSEHYGDYYYYYNDETDEITLNMALSADYGSVDDNYTNLRLTTDYGYGYSDSDLPHSETTPDYNINLIQATGNREYRIHIAYSSQITPDTLTLWCNAPVFLSEEDAKRYIDTGVSENQLNSGEDEVNDLPKQYYWEQYIYRYDYAFNNKTYVERIKYYYTSTDSDFRMCGWIDDSLSIPYNVSFKISSPQSASNYYFSTDSRERGTQRPSISGVPEKGLRGKVSDTNWIYYSVPHTNIPVAGSYDEAIRYVNKVIDDVNPPKIPSSDLSYKNTGDDTGDQTTQHINKNFAEPVLSSQYICDANQMSAIANVIFTDVETTQEALKKGLELYGENPVNDIIDVYHVPFDISGFVSNTANTNIKFGSYVSNAQGKRITTHGNVVTVGTAEIAPMFNDVRDWDGTLTLDLYLPFCGIMPLDVHSYMNRTLTIKATADTRSHNLRYYLFSNDVLMSYNDTAFGKPITLMGNDMASKFRQNMSANIAINNANEQLRLSGFGAALSAVTSGGGIGALASVTSSAIGLSSQASNLEAQKAQANLDFQHTKSARTFSGSQACGCSENDILYPYLIFRVQDTSIPANLKETYGRPCNLIGKIGSVSGYTVCDNAHIETNATLSEINEIQSLLAGGIFV